MVISADDPATDEQGYSVKEGALNARGAHDHSLWLRRQIAVIELDAWSNWPDGDRDDATVPGDLPGADVLIGGDGVDTVSYFGRRNPVVVDLANADDRGRVGRFCCRQHCRRRGGQPDLLRSYGTGHCGH